MNMNDLKAKLIEDYNKADLANIGQVISNTQKEEILKRADDVVLGIFSFTKPWDMECCCVPYELGDEPESYDWDIILHDDEEWCFMLNRMDYLEDLILAYLLTNDDKYALFAKRLILSWVNAHREIESSKSTRTLDTAIRIRTWGRVLSCLVACEFLDLLEFCIIYNNIEAQIKYMKREWLYKYMTSNWGTIQTCSILEVLARFGFNQENEYYTWARNTLKKQLVAQVYPDGVNWELSPMYHIEVMLYFNGCTRALKQENLKLPSNIERRICAMTYALAHQMLNAGMIDAQGDSDAVDVREVIALSAVTLNNAEFKYLAAKAMPSPFDILAFGVGIVDDYNKMPTFKSASLFFDGNDSGVFSARGSWEDSANSCLFLNGSLGSGHGHSDNLHVSCAYKGEPVLIDSGRYTYREDSDIRPYLKSPYAHNTLMVDNLSEAVPNGSWSYSSFITPIKTYTNHIRDTHYFEGSIIDKNTQSFITRKMFFVDGGIWIGFDEVLSSGKHSLDSRFHLSPNLNATFNANNSLDITCGLQFVSDADIVLDTDKCSRKYNELEEQKVIHTTLDFEGSSNSVWCMCPKEYRVEKIYVLQGGIVPVRDEVCSAVRVHVSDDEWYTFVVFHQEIYKGIKAFEVEGIPFHAKSVCIHVKGDKKAYMMFRA